MNKKKPTFMQKYFIKKIVEMILNDDYNGLMNFVKAINKSAGL